MNPYDPFIQHNAPLRGRETDLADALSMVGGHNVSIVAPKFYGKRALLREIEVQAKESGHFATVVYWDIKASPPPDLESFCAHLAQQIWDGWGEAGKYFPNGVDNITGEQLVSASERWSLDGHRLLLLWRGFDRVLSDPDLSPNLLGQLTSLTGNGSVSVVAATRDHMKNLLVHEADTHSDLWRRFSILRLEPMDDCELEQISAEAGILGPGAAGELKAQTGMVPPLLFALLAQIWKRKSADGIISKQAVIHATEAMDSRMANEVWLSLSEDSRRTMRVLAGAGNQGVPASELNECEVAQLRDELGLVRRAAGHFVATSKIFADHAGRQRENRSQMTAWFGSTEDYHQNIADVLRLRFKQVKMQMQSAVSRSVTTLFDNFDWTEGSLDTIRRLFSGLAAQVVGRVCPNEKVPQAFIELWKADTRGRRLPVDPNSRSTRMGKGPTMGLLEALNDIGQLPHPQVLPLFQILYEAGNIATHDEDHGHVAAPFAITVATAAVELLVLLDQVR